jgi:hypothetical protein
MTEALDLPLFPETDYGVFKTPEIDVKDIHARRSWVVVYGVKGFWGDPVKIYLQRRGKDWSARVEHSSGGYDSGVDQLDSETYFAMAVTHAVNLARTLRGYLVALDQCEAELKRSA